MALARPPRRGRWDQAPRKEEIQQIRDPDAYRYQAPQGIVDTMTGR